MQKVKIICIILAVVLVSAGTVLLVSNLSGNANNIVPPPADTESVVMDKPADGVFDKNDAKSNLYIAHGELKRSGGFRGESYGMSSSMGIAQEVASVRTVVGDNVFKQSISNGMVKMGTQVYLWGDNYLFRDVEKVRGINDVTWKNTARKVTEQTYYETYGYRFNAITGYILNDKTITDAYLESENDGVYTYRYVLDAATAPYYVLFEMRTNAGTKGFASFSKAEIVVEMDQNWQIKTLSTDCQYKVPMLGGVECTEHMREVFYDYGYNGDLPEKDFFENYFDAEISEPEEKDPDALSLLMDMFQPYLTGDKLNADIRVLNGGDNLVNAKLSAHINIENLDDITADVKVGESLFLNYSGKKLYLTYGDFKGSTTVDGIMSLVGSLTGNAASLDIDAESILASMSYKADVTQCVITLPLVLSDNLTINVDICGKAGGESYVFSGATVTIGDAVIDIVPCDKFDVPAISGDYPEILGLLDIIQNGVVSANAKLGDLSADIAYDIANNKLFAEMGDLSAVMQDGTVYATYGEVKVKLDLGDVKLITALLGDILGDKMPSLDMPALAIGDVLTALGNIKTDQTDSGVAFDLSIGDINVSITLVSNEGKWNIEAIEIATADFAATVTPSSADVQFPHIDANDYVDVPEMLAAYVAPIVSLLKADNYGVDFDLDLTLPSNEYNVVGSLIYDANGNVSVNALVNVNGKALVKADVTVASNTLYLNVNGIKAALKMSGESIDLKQVISAIYGKNEVVDSVIDNIAVVIDKLENIELSKLNIAKLIKSFSFEDDTLSVGVNAEDLGLGEFDVELSTVDSKLAASVNGLSLGKVALNAAAQAYASKNAVAVPNAEDYVTEIEVSVAGIDVTAKLDLYNKSVTAYATVLGEQLSLFLVDGTVYAIYGNVAVKLNIADIDKLISAIEQFVEMPSADLGKIDVQAILNSIARTDTDNGFDLTAVICGIAVAASFDKDVNLNAAVVSIGDVEVTAKLVNGKTYPQFDATVNYIDLVNVAETFAPAIKELTTAEGYAVNLNATAQIGNNVFGIVADVNYNQGLYANAELAINGVKTVNATIYLVDEVLYVEANGLRLAVNVSTDDNGDSNAPWQQKVRQFFGYNSHVDKLLALVLDITDNFRLDDIPSLVKALTFDGNALTLSVDGGQYGLSQFDVNVSSVEGVSVGVTDLSYDDISLTLNANVQASNQAVVAPQDDYLTNLSIVVDDYNTIYANLDILNGVYRFRLDNLNVMYANDTFLINYDDQILVKGNIAELGIIVERIKELMSNDSQQGGIDFGNIDLKEIVNSLTLATDVNSATITAAVANILLTVNLYGGDAPSLEVSLPVSLIDKTLVITPDEKREYCEFTTNEDEYVTIEKVFDDFFPAIEKLVKTQSWHFDIGAQIDVKGADGAVTQYLVKDSSFVEFTYVDTSDLNEFKLRVKLDVAKKVNDRWKDFMSLEVAFFDGRVFVNYNGLKITLSIEALTSCITNDPNEGLFDALARFIANPGEGDSLVDNLLTVVPQIKTAIDQMMAAKEEAEGKVKVIKYAEILRNVAYVNGVFDLTLNGEIFLEKLGDVVISVNREGDALKLNNLELSYDNVSVTCVTATVSAKDLDESNSFITGYQYYYENVNGVFSNLDVSSDNAVANAKSSAYHINLDSIKELLSAFVTTADDRAFYVDGTVDVTISLIFKININIGLAVKVDIDEKENVFVTARLARDNSTFYEDKGGVSYIIYDGSIDKPAKDGEDEPKPFTVVRNSYRDVEVPTGETETYYYCTKCGNERLTSYCWKCVSSKYTEKHTRDKTKTETQLVQNDYFANVSTNEFTANIMDYIFELINFTDTIEGLIKDQITKENTAEYGIEDIIKDYTYAEVAQDDAIQNGQSTLLTGKFGVSATLKPISSALGDVSLNIYHDSDYELRALTANMKLLGSMGNIDLALNLMPTSYGVATQCVKERTYW